jgi:hypothetical protein
MGHQVHGLEQAGLAAAVVAGDQVEPGLRPQFRHPRADGRTAACKFRRISIGMAWAHR